MSKEVIIGLGIIVFIFVGIMVFRFIGIVLTLILNKRK